MRRYQYTPLTDPSIDIRLVDLLPGTFDDDIYLDVLYFPLQPPAPKKSKRGRLTLRQISDTIPPGWKARVTREGRFLFRNLEVKDVHCWQWEHPDPNFDKSKYEVKLVKDPEVDEDMPESESDDEAEPCAVPIYEALSYTWNEGVGEEQQIFVDGPVPRSDRTGSHPYSKDSTHSTMSVGQSLGLALRHLRRADHSRRLWIDAVCINQRDNDEKGHQVRRMASIFQCARRVVGYLGETADNSSLALRTLRHLGRQIEIAVPNIRVTSPGAQHTDWVQRMTPLPYDAETWDAIVRLLDRKWFTRVWIIQESRLAGCRGIIQCGHDVISLSILRRAVKCLRGKHWLPTPDLRRRLEYVQLMTDDYEGLPFCAVLDMGYERQCFNPLDRLYGLLGIAPPRFAASLRPQYSKPVAEVMCEMVLTHMRHVQRLELLKRCYAAGRNVAGLPSWVPDLSSSTIFNKTRSLNFATGYSRAHFRHHRASSVGGGGQDVLELVGLRCATISKVSAPLLPDSPDPAAVIRSWQPPDLMTATYGPTGEPLTVAHAITLRTNCIQDRYPSFTCPSLRKWIEDNSGEVGFWGKDERTRPPTMDSHVHGRTFKLCTGKTYVCTEEGYVGLAPEDARPGDVIALFLGCDSPILIRPTAPNSTDIASESNSNSDGPEPSPATNTAPQTFTVVGECFVHGLNDATALLGPLPPPWVLQSGVMFGNRLSSGFARPDVSSVRVREDPRLAGVPLGDWERIAREPEADDPEIADYFRNRATGEVMNSDPRLLPEALRASGVDLTTIFLV